MNSSFFYCFIKSIWISIPYTYTYFQVDDTNTLVANKEFNNWQGIRDLHNILWTENIAII